MEVTAKARYIRMSPRKVRLVAGLVRGMGASQAEAQLGFSAKAAARPVLKLLQSAIANAEHNHQMGRDGLFIKSITVDGGPTLKRWRARAFGRAAPILKRTSHISIILAEREAKGGLKDALVKPAAKVQDEPAAKKPAKKAAKASAKPAAKKPAKKAAAKPKK